MESKEYNIEEFGDIFAAEAQSGYGIPSDDMNRAWQFIVNTGKSVFLTGKAGTGKTTFLKKLRQLAPKRMVVLAPTGVAAINAEGQTIHSFFQLPFGPFLPQKANIGERRRGYQISENKKKLIRSLDLIVIDEVSMVRADLMDRIDDTLRKLRNRYKPFGGVQLLLIGDLMQLAPVADNEEWKMLEGSYDTPYFFSSHALQKIELITVELRHIFRQQDQAFIDLLAKVREGRIDSDVLKRLNSRYIPGFEPHESGWIQLTTHNRTAQARNEHLLAKLDSTPVTLDAVISGDFPENSYPTDAKLVVKRGAQVMFVKNDPSGNHAYYNGKIGTVSGFDVDENGRLIVEVSCDDGDDIIKVTPVEWENTKYSIDPETQVIKEEIEGKFMQYPLRLAWAITVHKSQGLTFDHAMLDVNYSFAHGQVYVALSRCRSLEGLVLTRPFTLRSVINDSNVNTFINEQQRIALHASEQLPRYIYEYKLSLLDELYSFEELRKALSRMTRVVDEYLPKRQPELLQRLKALDASLEGELLDVACRFGAQYRQLLSSNSAELTERIRKSAVWFNDKLHELFDVLTSSLRISIENKQTKRIYENAARTLKSEIKNKEYIFSELSKTDFSVPAYLKLKARTAED